MKSVQTLIALSVFSIIAIASAPQTAMACSTVTNGTTNIVSSEAPACLVVEGTSPETPIEPNVLISNTCDTAIIVDCILENGSGACNEPLEIEPGEDEVYTFEHGFETETRRLTFAQGMSTGQIVLNVADTRDAGCGEETFFCAVSGTSPRAPSAPWWLALVAIVGIYRTRG